MKTVSQQRGSEIPRTRYEFTFLLLYSTLACPPFCLLESLVCLADLRLPYVSAARLSHRLLFSSSFYSLSPSLDPLPLYTRMIVLFLHRRSRSRLRRRLRYLRFRHRRRRRHRRQALLAVDDVSSFVLLCPYTYIVYVEG